MEFINTDFDGLVMIRPKVFGDNRGYFFETFRSDLFKANIGNITFVQDNESRSSFGVLRGLHYQLSPFSQSKLVRVIEGSILDVVVDIRRDSKTFGKHYKIVLSGENKMQLFIPKGFAHGFVVLSDFAIVNYKVDEYYAPQYDRGINAFDAELNIDWEIPKDQILRSSKDTYLPLLKDAEL